MNNKIVYENSSFFRRIARDKLRGNWITAVIVALIYSVMMGIVNFIFDAAGITGGVTVLGDVYIWIVMGPTLVGLTAFFMNLVRDKDPQISNVFEGFEQFGRAFVLGFFMTLFILLWSILLVIPGIIAAYRYSMAPCIFRDRPDLSAMDCIRESKRIMKGNKFSLFKLDLSFIGWAILAAIPSGIVAGCSEAFGASSVTFILLYVAAAPMLWLTAYTETANMAFYEDLITPDPRQYGYNNGGYNQYGQGQYDQGQYSQGQYDQTGQYGNTMNYAQQPQNAAPQNAAPQEPAQQIEEPKPDFDVSEKDW